MEEIRDYTLEFKAEKEKELEYIFIEDIVEDILKYLNDEYRRPMLLYILRIITHNDIYMSPFIGDCYSTCYSFGDLWKDLVKNGKTNRKIWEFIYPCFIEYVKAPICFYIPENEIKDSIW